MTSYDFMIVMARSSESMRDLMAFTMAVMPSDRPTAMLVKPKPKPAPLCHPS